MGSTSLQYPIDSTKPTDTMVPSSKVMNHGPHHMDHGSTHCPRCDSTHTKFCYYNNYSLSQPRYFCKSCRRYWTKGGTLRNIPVGGLCRKNKKISSTFKKPTTTNNHNTTTHHRQPQPSGMSSNFMDLHSPVEFSVDPHFMFENLTNGSPAAIDFLESGGGCGGGEYDDQIVDDFPAMVVAGGYGADMGNTHGSNPETISYDEYDHEYYESMMNGTDMKPSRVFTLGWQDQAGSGCDSDLNGSGEGRNGASGYLMGFGSSWAGLMN
ncbi:dof zinc finger protein DOF5.6-like [Cynara cardunculus var. scolymus]|uniref:Dof zinc finger protein n=1 Tax=Cynara cardunculus var. scolymus TaxID=59895 RepID=A0A103XWQ6_CYNCS|nr:dof zinc finger protein DOF5.6-like [Cynara cardunculus var. scolymus]KVH98221.1 hypothetical protein Ccrd_023580 [Cynara cardunculus var. scolymus]